MLCIALFRADYIVLLPYPYYSLAVLRSFHRQLLLLSNLPLSMRFFLSLVFDGDLLFSLGGAIDRFLLIMKLGGVNLIRYIVFCLMLGNKKKEGQSKIGSGELYN